MTRVQEVIGNITPAIVRNIYCVRLNSNHIINKPWRAHGINLVY